jgi:adenine-specific DNA-methyltransferase
MTTNSTNKKSRGQYFTIADELQQFVFDVVRHKGAPLLEPSFGAGHLLQKFKAYDDNYPMTCYEIDPTIRPCVGFNEHQRILYADFTTQTDLPQFATIIGNPPYVKERTGNLYLRFIEICYDRLTPDGELVFIVPSDFFKLTRAAPLISTMAAHGTFTDFLFPHNERLFDGASIDVVVFRYEKGTPSNATTLNGVARSYTVTNGILTFHEGAATAVAATAPLSAHFAVYVGLVSGKDAVYRSPLGNMELLTDKDRTARFIYATTFPTENEAINAHLTANKAALMARRIKTFTEANWFEWGAPRNIRAMETHRGRPCIYVRNMTRNREVAFRGTVQYFGGSLLCLIPTTEAAGVPAFLDAVVARLNDADFQKDYTYAGRFKIGHKQVSNVLLAL